MDLYSLLTSSFLLVVDLFSRYESYYDIFISRDIWKDKKPFVKSHAHHGFNGWHSSERLRATLGDSVENSLQTELGHVGVEDVLKTHKVR